MIEVYDGWSSTRHYIDYNAFARSQLGSFNTTIMKKIRFLTKSRMEAITLCIYICA